MNILCLGTSYTAITLAVNFFQHRLLFLSRRNISPQSQSEAIRKWVSANGRLDGILDTVPRLREGTLEMERLPVYWKTLQDLRIGEGIPYIHISSTGVYCEGSSQSVIEHHEVSKEYANTERAHRRLRLEQVIREKIGKALGCRVIVIRASAIYGPQRNVLYRIVHQKNFSRTQMGNRIVSRIHVYDLCQIILRALENPSNVPAMFHATDNHPISYMELYQHLQEKYRIRIPGNWQSAPEYGKMIFSDTCRKILKQYRFPNIFYKGALTLD